MAPRILPTNSSSSGGMAPEVADGDGDEAEDEDEDEAEAEDEDGSCCWSLRAAWRARRAVASCLVKATVREEGVKAAKGTSHSSASMARTRSQTWASEAVEEEEAGGGVGGRGVGVRDDDAFTRSSPENIILTFKHVEHVKCCWELGIVGSCGDCGVCGDCGDRGVCG